MVKTDKKFSLTDWDAGRGSSEIEVGAKSAVARRDRRRSGAKFFGIGTSLSDGVSAMRCVKEGVQVDRWVSGPATSENAIINGRTTNAVNAVNAITADAITHAYSKSIYVNVGHFDDRVPKSYVTTVAQSGQWNQNFHNFCERNFSKNMG